MGFRVGVLSAGWIDRGVGVLMLELRLGNGTLLSTLTAASDGLASAFELHVLSNRLQDGGGRQRLPATVAVGLDSGMRETAIRMK